MVSPGYCLENPVSTALLFSIHRKASGIMHGGGSRSAACCLPEGGWPGNAPPITADRLSGTLDRGPIAAAPVDTGLDSLY